MNKRRWGLLITISALVIVCVFGVNHVVEERAERRSQIEYQLMLKRYRPALKEYSDALKPGTTRREVESYLRSRNLKFSQMCCNGVPPGADALPDQVMIGIEKAPWCSQLSIYVDLEFAETEPRGSGTLTTPTGL